MSAPSVAQTISIPPHDISLFSGPGLDFSELATEFTEFSWETFTALNWPAKIDGEGNPIPSPDLDKNLWSGNNLITVWEAWPEAREVFLPNGVAPAAWSSPHLLPKTCGTGANRTGGNPSFVLRSTSKGGDVLDEFVQAFRMGPVIDANGEYVRFGINFNKSMFDYIRINKLYSKEGQQLFRKTGYPVSFPRGTYLGPEVGAIMVKSAWKILGAGDDFDSFHHIPAWIYSPIQPGIVETCRIAEVGLVGFHITHRTHSAPQWTWATFEHVANSPSWEEATGAVQARKHYSFYDIEKCPPHGRPSCPYNVLPARPWNPEIKGQEQSMVIRTGSISDLGTRINREYQDRLEGSVWSNYQIIDVQWPTRVKPSTITISNLVDPAFPSGDPSPSLLANSVLETYIQGFVGGDLTSNRNVVPQFDYSEDPLLGTGITGGARRSSSSCLGCHGDASMTTGEPANFVFSLNRAQ